MLYVTTANKYDAFTAHNTLSADRSKEGGLFVPYQLPSLSVEQIDALKDKSFGQRIADILNLFFSAQLSGWDVDFCIGRSPVKLASMSHRILIAETWHNLHWNFSRTVCNLFQRLLQRELTSSVPSSWVWTATRIAVLFGLFGETERMGLTDSQRKIDIVVAAGDFSTTFAAWYAREMGLPVGTIVCCCDENSGVWDLLHHGQMRTDTQSVPINLERLIFAVAGFDAVQNYRMTCSAGGIYMPGEEVLEKLQQGVFAAVVSKKRLESVIRNVYRTSAYILETDSALAYGGLQDYRAQVGETATALILAEKNPVCSAAFVADAIGIPVQELKNRMGVN